MLNITKSKHFITDQHFTALIRLIHFTPVQNKIKHQKIVYDQNDMESIGFYISDK